MEYCTNHGPRRRTFAHSSPRSSSHRQSTTVRHAHSHALHPQPRITALQPASRTATTPVRRNDGIYVIGNVTSLDIPYTVSGAVLTQDAHSVANDATTFSPLLFLARFGRGRAAGVASSAIVAGCCVPGFDDDGEGPFNPNANPKK